MSATSSRKEFVLVLGAGASKEAQLPTGTELKQEIAKVSDIRFKDGFTRSSGDALVETALRRIAKKLSSRADIKPLLHVCWRICNAMPLAISIDNFIDTHRADEQVAICGKVAIARCILTAENHSLLKVDTSNIYNKLDFARVSDMWFTAFFQLLTENCQREDLAERLKKFAILCFNYDRCVEHYLHSALQNYYALTAKEATEALANLEIRHPYGTVGGLPWQDRNNRIDFGGTPDAQQLIDLSEQLRTFTEGTDPNTSDIYAIRSLLLNAGRIVFLGFAFHRLNLQLLFQAEAPDQRLPLGQPWVYGTALGISASDVDVIRFKLSDMLHTDNGQIYIRNDLTCSQLFHEYWRSLSLT